jgi:enamine deaminase RidA (YjgF/YER057c/UK114 family)
MEREYLDPKGVYRHPAFTSIVTVTDPRKWHFFAGRCSVDEEYRCVAPGDFIGQYRRVMEILDLELRSVGATWDDVVFRRIFTLDVDAFLETSANDSVINGYWTPGRMPPSTLIGVTRLSDPEFLIEIDLMAVTD